MTSDSPSIELIEVLSRLEIVKNAPDHQIENLHSQIDKLKYQLNARSKGKINYN